MWNKFPQRGIYTPFRHLMVTLYSLFFLEYYEDPKYLSLEDNESARTRKDAKQTNKKFTFKSHEDS